MSEVLTPEQYYSMPRINLTGCVDDQMVKDLDMQVRNIDLKESEQVVVTLSTGGGGVMCARYIYEELQMMQQVTSLTLVARGACMSAGVNIAMAIPQEQRLATPRTNFYLHQPNNQTPVQISAPLEARILTSKLYDTNLAEETREANATFKLIAEGCGQKVSKIQKLAKSGIYFSSSEAVKFGLISGIIRTSA